MRKSRVITIERLSEDILLEIFDFYRLDAMKRARGRPWKWLRLAHVCRRWRHVISMSPRRLDLQIYCKSGASIKRTLAAWGTLPLIVRFKGGPKSNSLPNNIAIALRHPDRVREIDLGLTTTTVGSIVDAIRRPFQTLECIRITIKGATGPSLLSPNIFLGGSAPHLRVIALDGINFPFPEIKQVISSTNNLVELRLWGISKTGYFSADDLVTALSISAQLEKLEVSFHYPTSLPTESSTSPLQALQRTTFPSLRFLKFHGASEYLEEFVSRVDFPSLSSIAVGLFNQIFFEIPQICCSIPFVNASKIPAEVEIIMLTDRVSIYFRQKEELGIESRDCYLNTLCERLDWKLSFVTQVSSQLSPLLKSVGTLDISEYKGMPSGEDVDPMQWLELFQPFAHVRRLSVSGRVALDVMQALVTGDMAAGVLPELTLLQLSGRDAPKTCLAGAAEQFVAARKLSGRTIDWSIW